MLEAIISITTFCESVGGADVEVPYTIIQSSDNGYVLAGWTNSFGNGNEDVYIVKLKSDGSLEWQRVIGTSDKDNGIYVIQSQDGGYIIVGYSRVSSPSLRDNAYIIKLDNSGNLVWSKTFVLNDHTYFNSLVELSNGDLVITGNDFSTGGSMYFVKLDQNGNVKWTKSISNPNRTDGYSIIKSTDGKIVLYGHIISSPGKIYIVKADTNGSIIWQKTIQDNNYVLIFAGEISQTYDNGFILTGYAYSNNKYDAFVVKLKSDGSIDWGNVYKTTNNLYGFSIIQSPDTGYLLAGQASGSALLMKLNKLGSLEWARTYMGSSFTSVKKTNDGGYITAGIISNDFYIVKLDNNFNTCPGCTYTDITNQIQVIPFGSLSNGSGTLVSVNPAIQSRGNMLIGTGNLNPYCSVEMNEFSNMEIRICNNKIYMKNLENGAYISIYDIQGRVLIRKRIVESDFEINLSELKKGIYMLEVKAKSERLIRGFIK